MRQDSFSGSGFEKYRKKTRKEQFLAEMESIIPWKCNPPNNAQRL
jgi:transposase, IS5 family